MCADRADRGLAADAVTTVVYINGSAIAVPEGASVVAALAAADLLCTRRSVTGESRFALCGMGQCHECRVTIDGRPHRLACQTLCRDGMLVITGEGGAIGDVAAPAGDRDGIGGATIAARDRGAP